MYKALLLCFLLYLHVISKLNDGKSPGYDQIPNAILKKAGHTIIVLIRHIFCKGVFSSQCINVYIMYSHAVQATLPYNSEKLQKSLLRSIDMAV